MTKWWSNFRQEYLDDDSDRVSYSWITNKHMPLSRTFIDTRKILYNDFDNFIKDYNPSKFKELCLNLQ